MSKSIVANYLKSILKGIPTFPPTYLDFYYKDRQKPKLLQRYFLDLHLKTFDYKLFKKHLSIDSYKKNYMITNIAATLFLDLHLYAETVDYKLFYSNSFT